MRRLHKDTIKVIRTTFQIVFLLVCVGMVASLFIERGDPPVFDRENWTQRDGFMAISYSSLTRDERPGMNSRGQFARHVAALKDAGYTWITTQDVVDFYHNNKPLPEKALYLMLEGGRKDNVIFGQNIIGPASAHATLFTYTQTLSSWNNFFVTYSNVASLAKSHFWDVGSQGYRLLRINENIPGVEPGYFVADFVRDAAGKRAESDEEMFARLSAYYEKSFEPLNTAMPWPPLAYILMPANTFHAYMPPELQEANKMLMEKYFKTSFTREGPAFNSAVDDVHNLSRMQVGAQWSGDDLLEALRKWNFSRDSFDLAAGGGPEDWFVFRTRVTADGDALVLAPEEGFVDPAVLRGTNLWDNVNISVTFDKRDLGERYIYLRYASRDAYLRLTLRFNRLLVQERLPDMGLFTMYDGVLPTREPWDFDIKLKGNRLFISVNGKALKTGLLPLSAPLQRGAVALGASPIADYEARFSKLKVTFQPSLWKLEEGDKPLPPEAESQGVVAANILPVSENAAGNAGIVHALLRARGEGHMAIAALPPGQTTFSPESLRVPPYTSEESAKLWNGLMLTPGPDADWQAVGQSLARAAAGKYHGVLRLSAKTAERLAALDQPLQVDYLVLDFAKEDLPPAIWTALAHKYNRNNFLYAFANAGADNARLYAVRRD